MKHPFQHLICLILLLSPLQQAAADKKETQQMAQAFFTEANYAKALKLALASNDKKGTHGHDVSLFIQGGSHYYLGNFAIAQPLLTKHLDLYPNSKLAMHSMYFEGSNLTRLQKWDDAEVLLRDFLDEYKDPTTNTYHANALYDLANCTFANGKLKEGIQLTKRIEKEAPKANIIDMTYALRGNLEESLGNYAIAETYYKKALTAAEKSGNRIVAGESLSYLISMLGAKTQNRKLNPRTEEAIPYLENLWKNYQDSPYLVQGVVYARTAMVKAGRGPEQMQMLRKVIAKISQKKKPVLLEESVNAHTKEFLSAGGTLTELEKLYLNFPGLTEKNIQTKLLLKLSFLGELESLLSSKKTEPSIKPDLTKRINKSYQELAQSPTDQLSSFALLKIALHLKKTSDNPEAALPFYMALTTRDGRYGKAKAQLGVGEILAQSRDANKRKRGLQVLEKLIANAGDDLRAKEDAIYTIIQSHLKAKQWTLLEKQCRNYIEAKATRKSAEVSYLLALSYDKRNMINDAVFHYSMVYSRYPGFLQISSIATHRVCELLWQRNKKAGDQVGKKNAHLPHLTQDDRNIAIEVGQRFLRITKKIRASNSKISAKEKANWDKLEKLIQTYEKQMGGK